MDSFGLDFDLAERWCDPPEPFSRVLTMHVGKLVFAQLTGHLPLTTFRRCVAAYGGEHKIKSFSCLDQFLCLAFAQLTYRESLRDIEACLRAQSDKPRRPPKFPHLWPPQNPPPDV